LTRIVDEFAMSVIRDRRNVIHTNERAADERFDLLTKYIEHAKANGEDLPDKYLRDVLMNVMLAGE
jgi:cytochrome P450